MSQTYLTKLDSAMRDLPKQLGVSAEVIVVAGQELLWHSKTDDPDPNVVVRANVGFRRSLYELDVLSRLYLSRLDWEDVQARFFFRRVARNRVRNHVGIRRCANVVEDPNGKFLHLLALAEPVDRTFWEELCYIKQDHSRPEA